MFMYRLLWINDVHYYLFRRFSYPHSNGRIEKSSSTSKLVQVGIVVNMVIGPFLDLLVRFLHIRFYSSDGTISEDWIFCVSKRVTVCVSFLSVV